MIIHVQIKPGARKNEVVTLSDGSKQIKIKVEAIEGKANQELIKFIAELFKIAKSAVTLLHGHTSKFKKLELAGDEVALQATYDKYLK